MTDSDFPTDAHKLFHPFIGKFRAEVKLFFGPGDPQVSTGVMTNTMELNHQFLFQVYDGDPTEGPYPPFQGRGYWGFNTVTGKYEGFWIDIASTVMMMETGDVDPTGKVWTMQGGFESPKTGERLQKRTVITVLDDDHHTMEQFLDGPDGEQKTMEINYSRHG